MSLLYFILQDCEKYHSLLSRCSEVNLTGNTIKGFKISSENVQDIPHFVMMLFSNLTESDVNKVKFRIFLGGGFTSVKSF